MKKIYLLLLFFPLGIIAQSEETKSEPEKTNPKKTPIVLKTIDNRIIIGEVKELN